MASGRTIDSLVVLLGLNAKGFSAGMKGATNELTSFTRRLATMFVAVRGLEDVVDYFKDLHRTLTDVGYSERNLGVLGTQLRQFSEVSELFGGRAEDAAASIQGLQSALFQLRFMGQMSEPLMMMQRFGVAYMTASGQMLNFRAIALNAARVIGDQARTQGLDPGQRYQLALSMGFQGGIASAVAQGGKGLEQALKESKTDQKALTEQTIRGQVELARHITQNTYQLQAVNSAILSKMTPDLNQLITLENKLVNTLLPKLNFLLGDIDNFLRHPPSSVKEAEGYGKDILHAGEGAFDWLKGKLGTAGAVGALYSGWKIGKSFLGGFGRALLTGGAGEGAGVAGSAAIPGIGELVLGAVSVIGLNDLLSRAPALNSWGALGNSLTGIFGGPTSRAALGASGGVFIPPSLLSPPPTPTASRGATGSWGPAAGGASGSWNPLALVGAGGTNVEIGEITITTRATDANGIASSLDGALKRKLLTSSADRGQS